MKRRCLAIFIWSLSLIFYLYQYVARASVPNVLNNQLMDYFQIDATAVCGLFSAFYLIYMVMQIPVGYLLDRFGTKHVSFFSVLCCAAGLFLFISTRNYNIAICGQLLVGMGSSFAFILSLKLAEEMFPPKRLPMMSAILNSSGAFGAFFMSPIVARLSDEFSITQIVYFMSAIGVMLAFLLLTFVHHKERHTIMEASSIVKKIKTILANKQIILIAFNSMLMYSVVVVFADHFGVAYMSAVFGAELVEASWMCSMIYIGIILGSPIFAFIANKFNSYKISLLTGASSTLLVLCILLFCDLGKVGAPIAMLALGLSVSSQVMSFPAVMSLVPHELTATASSIVNTITTLSGVVIYPLVGFIMDQSHNSIYNAYSSEDFKCGFILLPIVVLIAIALLAIVKIPVTGKYED